MWIDHGSYYEHSSKQGTDPWKEVRIGRISASNSGTMAEQSIFKTSEAMGKIIAGVEEEHFTEEELKRMSHGNMTEDSVRKWYEKQFNCKILEKGLCVPKSDYTIGASIDGEILNSTGIIEIKCPQKMYYPLEQYMDQVNNGWKPPSNYYNHIWKCHYSQMQQCLYVLKKDWCEYIVYSTNDSKVFTQKIPFDPVYWEQHYLKIKENYEKYVKPHLLSGYPIMPR